MSTSAPHSRSHPDSQSAPHPRRWTADDVPDQTGKTFVVTGANSGLGFHTAQQLSRNGGHVILACRDLKKAEQTIARLRAADPDASLEAMELDLASLASIRSFSETFCDRHASLDVLCNNAGVMAIPLRRTTEGFEMQLGTNHLGHFALTGLLLERLLTTPRSRVVNVSSNGHKLGAIRFHDLQWQRGYGKWRAYCQSKLANLLFAYELQRRLEAAGAGTISVAAHPGYAATNLQVVGAQMEGSALMERLGRLGNRLFAQSAEMGCLPSLYAATAEAVRGGDYYGPDGFLEQAGYPTRAKSSRRSHDEAAAARLWKVSEELTSVSFDRLA